MTERKKMKLIKLMLIIAVFAISVGAAEVKDASMTGEDLTNVAAIVNGQKIAISEVDSLAEMTLSRYPEQMRASQEKVIKKKILDTKIFGELVSQKATEMGIKISDESCESEVTKMISGRGISLEDYKKMIADAGRDYNELLGQVRKSLEFEEIIVKLSDADKLKVSDEDIKTFFDENKDKMAAPAEVKASHILVKAENESEKAAAKAKIEEILAKLKAGGDFASLAKENSDCPSKERGGDLGFFGQGQMVKPFEDAAFGMEVGDISDVVETQFGYHIILVTDKHEAKEAIFDELKDQIKDELENRKKGEAAEVIREDMMKTAKIQYSDIFKPEETPEGTEIKVEK